MQTELSQIAEISVSYYPTSSNMQLVKTSKEAYLIFQKVFPTDTLALQETFMAMYLNRANHLLGVYKVSTGGLTGTIADPKLILAVGLKTAATSIILAHNHPSGNMKPSIQDEDLTAKIKEGAKWFDINLLDHLLLSPFENQYFSFADEGIL